MSAQTAQITKILGAWQAAAAAPHIASGSEQTRFHIIRSGIRSTALW
jgi:hypothetical protein